MNEEQVRKLVQEELRKKEAQKEGERIEMWRNRGVPYESQRHRAPTNSRDPSQW